MTLCRNCAFFKKNTGDVSSHLCHRPVKCPVTGKVTRTNHSALFSRKGQLSSTEHEPCGMDAKFFRLHPKLVARVLRKTKPAALKMQTELKVAKEEIEKMMQNLKDLSSTKGAE